MCWHRRERVPALLARLRLSHGEVAVHSTPRRLAVAVAAVAARQPDVEESVRGPPAKVRLVSKAQGLPVSRIVLKSLVGKEEVVVVCSVSAPGSITHFRRCITSYCAYLSCVPTQPQPMHRALLSPASWVGNANMCHYLQHQGLACQYAGGLWRGRRAQQGAGGLLRQGWRRPGRGGGARGRQGRQVRVGLAPRAWARGCRGATRSKAPMGSELYESR